MELFEKKVKALKTGNPLDEDTDVGPLIDEPSVTKTLEWVDEAVKSGAKLVSGGARHGNNLMDPSGSDKHHS